MAEYSEESVLALLIGLSGSGTKDRLRLERDEARADVMRMEQKVADYQAAWMLVGKFGDPENIEPIHVEREITTLRAEIESLRKAIAIRLKAGHNFTCYRALHPSDSGAICRCGHDALASIEAEVGEG